MAMYGTVQLTKGSLLIFYTRLGKGGLTRRALKQNLQGDKLPD